MIFGLLISGTLLGALGVYAYYSLPPSCSANGLWLIRLGTVVASIVGVILGRYAYAEGGLRRTHAIVGASILALMLIMLFYGATPLSPCADAT